MKKKDKGIVDNILGLLITIVFMTIIVMQFMYYSNQISTKNNIDAVCRMFMLRMETEGYLTGTDRQELEQELSKLGVVDIDLSGTTVTETVYGTRIYLHVKGNATVKGIHLGNGTGLLTNVYTIPFDIKKESVSKN